MTEFTVITIDNLHSNIFSYIKENSIEISEYEDMKETILKMIREGCMFNMDRDRLRDAMEDITYVINSTDVVNKDRVARGLEYDEDSDKDEEDYMDDNEIIKIMKKIDKRLDDGPLNKKGNPDTEPVGEETGNTTVDNEDDRSG